MKVKNIGKDHRIKKSIITKLSQETKVLLKRIKIATSESELNEIAIFFKNTIYQGVHNRNNYYAGKEIISLKKGRDDWNLVFSGYKVFKKDKILNVGCGLGLMELWGLKNGYMCYGIEPDLVAESIASKLLSLNGYCSNEHIFREYGEKIHFEDGCFDVVISQSALEHVLYPEAVLNEILRVLKPGGTLIVICPNYSFFWEFHYSLPWLPIFSKNIAKFYVRLLGRRAEFIDEINFIKPSLFKSFFKTKGIKFKNYSEQAMKLMIQTEGSISQPFLKEIMKWASPLLLKTISSLHTYPYIKIVAKKP